MVAQLEGSTFGAAAGSHVGILMTDLNGIQRAVLLVAAMVGAAGDAAFDAGIGILVVHLKILLIREHGFIHGSLVHS